MGLRKAREISLVISWKKNVRTSRSTKDLYQVQETLKKLCEFSTILADLAERADLGSTESVPQTDSNFPNKGQFFISIFNNIPKLEKVGVTLLKTKKAC